MFNGRTTDIRRKRKPMARRPLGQASPPRLGARPRLWRRINLLAAPRIGAEVCPADQFGQPQLVRRKSAGGDTEMEYLAFWLCDVRVHRHRGFCSARRHIMIAWKGRFSISADASDQPIDVGRIFQ